MRYVLLAFVLLISLNMIACGNKRGPTGGDQDLDKPTVLSSSPAEMGDISGGIIEIDFDKPMDKSSLPNAIYFYPPITEKRISLSRQTLTIEIKEKLQDDTLYYITLSTRIKDTRGNNLDKAHTLIFANGNPSKAKLSGLIAYEKGEDANKAINMSLFSADSLLVMMKELSGSSYELTNLSPGSYRMRGYIDNNLNGRYDETAEPFYEAPFSLTDIATMDMNMAYVDTSWAQIRSVKQHSRNELEITLSESVRSFSDLSIKTEPQGLPLDILHQFLDHDKLYLLTAAMDSTRYTIHMTNLEDNKGVISPGSGFSFTAAGLEDGTAPVLLSSNPRNGATVNSLRPTIELNFSEIIPAAKLSLRMIETDSKKEVPVYISDIRGRSARVTPTKDLANYRSHTLIIDASSSDFSGNQIGRNIEILFLPISRR